MGACVQPVQLCCAVNPDNAIYVTLLVKLRLLPVFTFSRLAASLVAGILLRSGSWRLPVYIIVPWPSKHCPQHPRYHLSC